MATENCAYLRACTGNVHAPDGRDVYECLVHGQCVREGLPTPYASCESCKQGLPLDSPQVASSFIDHLVVLDSTRTRTHALRNMLRGGVSFLVCGGPSAKALPLERLRERGVWSMAVNNMAGYARTNAFVCSDPPSKFCDGIWLDPTVYKFVPTPKMAKVRSSLRHKTENGFVPLEVDGKRMRVLDCPNVWGFERRAWLQTDHTFFTENSASWGNHNAGAQRTGLEKTVCTMLLGMRLLYYLGSRRIYLVGVDFGMTPTQDLHANYAFGEQRDGGAIDSNNNQYRVVGKWLCDLQKEGVFAKFGLEVYNCNPYSSLRAFEHVPFDFAIDDARKHLPKEPFDLEGWYEKSNNVKT